MSCNNRTLNSAANVAGKAAVGLFRWMTTDHIGQGRSFQNIPTIGFFDTIRYFLKQMIFGILSAVLSGAIAYVLIAYGIPFLIWLVFYR